MVGRGDAECAARPPRLEAAIAAQRLLDLPQGRTHRVGQIERPLGGPYADARADEEIVAE